MLVLVKCYDKKWLKLPLICFIHSLTQLEVANQQKKSKYVFFKIIKIYIFFLANRVAEVNHGCLDSRGLQEAVHSGFTCRNHSPHVVCWKEGNGLLQCKFLQAELLEPPDIKWSFNLHPHPKSRIFSGHF